MVNIGGRATERLDRFPDVFSLLAVIPKHQLGWRMAVLPFRFVGTTSGFEIAFGMAEEITAAISRFRSPRLMAPATFWDGIGPAADVLGRSRMYELDYMMDGTVEVTGNRVRVRIVLLDVVLDFEPIWTGDFEDDFDELYSLQDRIAVEAVKQLDPDLYRRGTSLDAPVRPCSAASHRLVLGAIHGIYHPDRSTFVRARASLERAIALDPNYAAAHSWLAYWAIMAVGQGWIENPADATALAGTSASRAVELDPSDARGIAIAGHVRGYLFHDVSTALAYHARAVDLNPNLPAAWSFSSCSRFYNGEHATSIRHAMISLSLSPRDPHIFFTEHALMVANFLKGELEEAAKLSEIVMMRNQNHISALFVTAAIYGHLGRHDDAARCVTRLRMIDNNLSVAKIVARVPFTPRDKAYYAAGLKLAGVRD
jgi:TolB-like protein